MIGLNWNRKIRWLMRIFFKTKDDFDQAVTGLYSMLRPLDDEAKDGAYFGNLYWEVCADVCMYKNSWTQPWFDISRGELKSVTDNVASLYQKVYAAISWSNTIIKQIEAKQSEFPEDFVNYVKGQAHFCEGYMLHPSDKSLGAGSNDRSSLSSFRIKVAEKLG